ncbi:MAG: hypothetical protein V1659_04670 [Candidatus Woesearchaeota archaeon]
MASIPGPAWIIIGVVVGVFAWIVQKATQQKGMVLFIAIAGLFVFIGVIKTIWASSKKKRKSREKEEFPSYRTEARAQFKPEHYPEQPSLISQNRIIMCHNCGTKHYSYSNFCHICGARLKR